MKRLAENQFAYFFQRAVLAKAFVGLGEPQQARHQFDDIHRRIERRRHSAGFYHSHAALSLPRRILPAGCRHSNRRARWARQLRDYAAPAPDHNHLAQAHGLLARIALAAGDPGEARLELSTALSIVDNADFPLASWRVS